MSRVGFLCTSLTMHISAMRPLLFTLLYIFRFSSLLQWETKFQCSTDNLLTDWQKQFDASLPIDFAKLSSWQFLAFHFTFLYRTNGRSWLLLQEEQWMPFETFFEHFLQTSMKSSCSKPDNGPCAGRTLNFKDRKTVSGLLIWKIILVFLLRSSFFIKIHT